MLPEELNFGETLEAETDEGVDGEIQHKYEVEGEIDQDREQVIPPRMGKQIERERKRYMRVYMVRYSTNMKLRVEQTTIESR